MAKNLQEKPKRTINEWLENLPSKVKAQKIDQLIENCPAGRSTIYKWKNGESIPHKKTWRAIQKVAGKEVKIKFN